MNKTLKILTTFSLTLFTISLILFFLIYPNYNSLKLKLNSIDIYKISKETTFTALAYIAPQREDTDTNILGATSIEESLQNIKIDLRNNILEKVGTKLHINSAEIEGHIFQGVNAFTMDKGFWHFPISSFPGEQGNVVIIGHRFLHIPPLKDTFFNLDKVKVGEEIIVSNIDGEYTYIVTDIDIVEANDTSVVQDTNDYRLTLITCTPLWTSEKRLVVVAKLDKLYKKV